MSFAISEFLGFFIIIPAIIGMIRFVKINPIFRPFIYCIWIGLGNEILSFIIIKSRHSNAVNGNIYMLVEFLLFTWQFIKWGLFDRKVILLRVLLIAVAGVWVFENLVFFHIKHFSSYFLISYSFAISLMSIAMINRLLTTEKGALLKNAVFLICSAFSIYYTFSAIAEAFWIYGLDESKLFRINIISITVITNLIANLLYSIAVLWMPTKQKFILPFS